MEKIYKKNDSFVNLKIKEKNNEDVEQNAINAIEEFSDYFKKDSEKKILSSVLNDLRSTDNTENKFNIKINVKKEIEGLTGINICKYLIHRYRYEIFPAKYEIDKYPPYLQIEPTSTCNYRCVFCYQTDNVFNKKSNGFMGHMALDMFKKVIDQAENNVEFISIASRGEPLMCPDIIPMLKYTSGKFLNLKLNTNASVLDEKKIHAILEGGVKTLVFSADAAEPKSYSKLRVNGKLETVLKNIKKFKEIKEKNYKDSKIITRVSGVKVSNDQNIDNMETFWGDVVDQVAFVDYVPWENVYDSRETKINKPCSDLWRRMFVWWDGKINPCDVDYKSDLEVGNINNSDLSQAWTSNAYKKLRENHLNNLRKNIHPCNKCAVI